MNHYFFFNKNKTTLPPPNIPAARVHAWCRLCRSSHYFINIYQLSVYVSRVYVLYVHDLLGTKSIALNGIVHVHEAY